MKGKKTGGRKKGSVNKSTAAVKDALTKAFEELGGVDSLVSWGRSNETEFYKLWVKMMPQEVNAEVNANLTMTHEQMLEQLDDPDDAA